MVVLQKEKYLFRGQLAVLFIKTIG
jgi:hypothetical protein